MLIFFSPLIDSKMFKLLTIFVEWAFLLVFLNIKVRILLTFSAKYHCCPHVIYSNLKETHV